MTDPDGHRTEIDEDLMTRDYDAPPLRKPEHVLTQESAGQIWMSACLRMASKVLAYKYGRSHTADDLQVCCMVFAYCNYQMNDPEEEGCQQMYWALAQAYPVEDMNHALLKIGGWFLKRTHWSQRTMIAAVTRSVSRLFNDRECNKAMQILFVVLAHEFHLAWLAYSPEQERVT